jgi:hypothetical protein
MLITYLMRSRDFIPIHLLQLIPKAVGSIPTAFATATVIFVVDHDLVLFFCDEPRCVWKMFTQSVGNFPITHSSVR